MNGQPTGGINVISIHPAIVRICHWLNVLAVFIMVGSGWRIYDNLPIVHWLIFPQWLTLGGDPEITYSHNGDTGFSNALLWHFAGMWLLVVNGLIYVIYGVFSGRFRAKLFPLSPRSVLRDIIAALTFKLNHDDISMYKCGTKAALYRRSFNLDADRVLRDRNLEARSVSELHSCSRRLPRSTIGALPMYDGNRWLCMRPR